MRLNLSHWERSYDEGGRECLVLPHDHPYENAYCWHAEIDAWTVNGQDIRFAFPWCSLRWEGGRLQVMAWALQAATGRIILSQDELDQLLRDYWGRNDSWHDELRLDLLLHHTAYRWRHRAYYFLREVLEVMPKRPRYYCDQCRRRLRREYGTLKYFRPDYDDVPRGRWYYFKDKKFCSIACFRSMKETPEERERRLLWQQKLQRKKEREALHQGKRLLKEIRLLLKNGTLSNRKASTTPSAGSAPATTSQT